MVDRTLDLIRDVRHLAYDASFTDDDRCRRLRDRLGEHDGIFDDPNDRP